MDNAERLSVLMRRMQTRAEEVSMAIPSGGTQILAMLPLWQAFNPLAQSMGYEDYGFFRDSFVSLVVSVSETVSALPMQKESVREAWLQCVLTLAKVFDARNFRDETRAVFANYFSGRTYEILDSISERFQAANIRETTQDEMISALDAMHDAIVTFCESKGVDPRIQKVLQHYYQQIEQISVLVDDFGDEMFWKVYKETFATFVQLHPVIAGLENSDEVKSKVRAVAEKLSSKAIAGVGLVADLATIGAAGYALLG